MKQEGDALQCIQKNSFIVSEISFKLQSRVLMSHIRNFTKPPRRSQAHFIRDLENEKYCDYVFLAHEISYIQCYDSLLFLGAFG